MAKGRKREYPDDDGRTIVPMNVDGMPWYTRGVDSPPEEKTQTPPPKRPEMSKDETRGYIWAAVKAGLLIASVFVVVYFLFILFCTRVWLR